MSSSRSYVLRARGGWAPWFYLTPVLAWLLPFCVLLSRGAKRNPRVLRWVSVTVLLGHWLDLYILATPPVLGPAGIGLPASWPAILLEALITLGYASLFFLLFARALRRAPLLARHDPYLAESLHHHA